MVIYTYINIFAYTYVYIYICIYIVIYLYVHGTDLAVNDFPGLGEHSRSPAGAGPCKGPPRHGEVWNGPGRPEEPKRGADDLE